MTKKKFKITGMHCTSCAFNIDGDLEDSGKVIDCSTSYAKQVTEVTFDEKKTSHEEIIKIIEKTGYSAQVLEEK